MDIISNYKKCKNKFEIIESTLREGEQFINSNFSIENKICIVKMLNDFGIEYIELSNPLISEQSFNDCKTICKLGLKSKILTHVRCNMKDVKLALKTGVQGIDLLFGTSSLLRKFSHGKNIDFIINSTYSFFTNNSI